MLKTNTYICLICCFSSFFIHAKPRYEESIIVHRLKDGKTLYKHHPNKDLTPASLSKLFTSAALLHHMGSQSKLRTKFYYTGKKEKNIIHGDLIVVGDGDPYLVSEDLWTISNEFRLRGVHKLKGHLSIDSTQFYPEDISSSFKRKHSSQKSYTALGSTFLFNFNFHSIRVY